MTTITPEIAGWGAFANVISDYLGDGAGAHVETHGPYIDIVVENIPVFGSADRTDAIFRMPAGTLRVGRNGFGLKTPLQGDNVQYLLKNGKAFPHPHIWDSGRPCWNGQSLSRMGTLFENIVNTITWNNVTEESMNVGHFTDCTCSRSLENDTVRKINRHKKRVADELEIPAEPPMQYYVDRINPYLDFALRRFL